MSVVVERCKEFGMCGVVAVSYTHLDNTVKEKGLQNTFILRQMLLQSFYASTA